MPDLFTLSIMLLELGLLLAGLALLWRQAFSREARAAAHTAARNLPAWDVPLGDFFLFLWIVICTGLLVQAALSAGLRHAAIEDDTRTVLAGGGFHLGMLAGLLGFRRFSGRPKASDTGRTLGAAGAAARGMATFLIVLPLLTVCGLGWQQLLKWVGLPADQQDLIGLFAGTNSPSLLALLTVLAIFVAPVTEELLFRAGLFRYARTRLPRWAALLLPACLFGALHANLASFAPLVVLGVVFSLAYERTGSIAVPMIAHGLFNLNTILLIFSGIGLQ